MLGGGANPRDSLGRHREACERRGRRGGEEEEDEEKEAGVGTGEGGALAGRKSGRKMDRMRGRGRRKKGSRRGRGKKSDCGVLRRPKRSTCLQFQFYLVFYFGEFSLRKEVVLLASTVFCIPLQRNVDGKNCSACLVYNFHSRHGARMTGPGTHVFTVDGRRVVREGWRPPPSRLVADVVYCRATRGVKFVTIANVWCAAQVGLFEFCRALDAASDWVAFVQPPPTVQGGGERRKGRGSSVPVFWALSGVRRVFCIYFYGREAGANARIPPSCKSYYCV